MKKLPKRARTLSNKIRKDNPWNAGVSLADFIDLKWDEIKITRDLHALSGILLLWAKAHYLSSYHTAATIERLYL